MSDTNPDIVDVRTLIISDTHIGYNGSDLHSLLDFIRRTRCRYLFLNGDIVDSWKLEAKWDWPKLGTDIIREIMLKHLQGTKVIYLPGNHDEELRYVDLIEREQWIKNLGIKIRHTYVHKTLEGKKFLLLHGDQFDAGILRAGLSHWSDKIWVEIAKILPIKLTIGVGGRVFSFAAEVAKKAGKKTLNMISRHEKAAWRRAKLRGVDGIMCGHTHLPGIKTLKDGIIYANSGMWQGAGKNFALTEDWDGAINLIEWQLVAAKDVMQDDSDPKLFKRADAMTANIIKWLENNVAPKLEFEDEKSA